MEMSELETTNHSYFKIFNPKTMQWECIVYNVNKESKMSEKYCSQCKYFSRHLTKCDLAGCNLTSKPKFEPINKETKMTDTEFDVNTPGALVGKFVNHCGDKHIVYGDLRFGLNTAVFCFALFNPQARTHINAKVDTISPWIEPVVKAKVKRVKVFYKCTTNDTLIETRWYLTVEDIKKAYGLKEVQIIETEYREFQE